MPLHTPTPDATEREPDGVHPWAARAGRFPRDDELRAAGYEIAERHGKDEPRWRMHGRGPEIDQRLALEMVRKPRAKFVSGSY